MHCDNCCAPANDTAIVWGTEVAVCSQLCVQELFSKWTPTTLFQRLYSQARRRDYKRFRNTVVNFFGPIIIAIH